MQLEKINAVITGGASGIGRGIAEILIQRSCRVVIADFDLDRAEATASALGDRAFAVRCDVSKHDAVVQLVERSQALLGRIDAVFANAGVGYSSPVISMTPEQFDWVMGVNIRGVWSTAAAFGSHMIATGTTGHICLTASEHALGFQHDGMGIYTASKHAVLGMADVMRRELPSNIGLSVFCPGLVASEMHLARRTSPFGPSDPAETAVSAAVIARGMPVAQAASDAIAGVERGDFLIVTHPHSVRAAENRFAEIRSAFSEQAPMCPGGDKYEVNRIVAEVMAVRAASQGRKGDKP